MECGWQINYEPKASSQVPLGPATAKEKLKIDDIRKSKPNRHRIGINNERFTKDSKMYMYANLGETKRADRVSELTDVAVPC